MIGCLRTRVRKQPIIALYFEFESEIKFYNLEARQVAKTQTLMMDNVIKYHYASLWAHKNFFPVRHKAVYSFIFLRTLTKLRLVIEGVLTWGVLYCQKSTPDVMLTVFLVDQ